MNKTLRTIFLGIALCFATLTIALAVQAVGNGNYWTAGSNISITNSTIAVASPSATACPSAMVGLNSSNVFQSQSGCMVQAQSTAAPTQQAFNAFLQAMLLDAATVTATQSGTKGQAVVAQVTAAPTVQPGYIATTNCCDAPLVSGVAFTAAALTQSSYVTLASPSVTLGTSKGPTGAWIVRVTFQAAYNQTTGTIFHCIVGTSAGTNAYHSYTSNVACFGSPTNALAGTANQTNPQNNTPAVYVAQYTNGSSLTFNCEDQITTSTATQAYGYCDIQALPI